MSSSSSHYIPPGGYDDLRLPPIRNTASYSSTSRAHATSKHVTTMEPPTFTSSTDHLRKASVTLPPLSNLEPRPRTSLGHSSHTSLGPPSLPFSSNPRQPSSHSSHASNLPPITPSYRPSSSQRGTADYDDPPPPAHSQPHTKTYHYTGFHNSSHDAILHTSSRAFACDICGATFSRAYDCKRHRDIHTRQGGHQCPTCHKSLSRADALKRHMERGCSGTGNEDDDPEEIERDHQRDKRKEKRHSVSADTSSKYYYTSSSSRHH